MTILRPTPTERHALVHGELIDPDWYRFLKEVEGILLTGALGGMSGLDTSVGLVVQQSAAYVFVKRVLAAGSAALTWMNPDGVAGNPSIDVSAALAALHALALGSTAGLIAHTAANTVANRLLVGSTGLVVSNADGGAGNPTVTLDSNLQAIAGLGNGVPVRTGAGTWVANVMLSANNGQVAFPATQNPSAGANVLDDYEEGTWTPIFTAATPPTTVTYTAQSGNYTKVGRLVQIGWNLTVNSKGAGGAGQVAIGGLPFSLGAFPAAGIGTSYYAGVTLPGGGIGINWAIFSGTSMIGYTNLNASAGLVNWADIAATGFDTYGGGSYGAS